MGSCFLAFPFSHGGLREELSTEQLRRGVMQHILTAWPVFHLDFKSLKQSTYCLDS